MSTEIYQTEKQREKEKQKKKKKEHNIQEMWDSYQKFNIHVIEIAGEKRKQLKKYFK